MRFFSIAVALFLLLGTTWAQDAPAGGDGGGPLQISINTGTGDNNSGNLTVTLQLLILFTVLSIAPAIILMTTCFVRIIIVLSFVKQALSLQVPPNQVLISLALFMTIFIMMPTMTRIYDEAIVPMRENQISTEEGFAKATVPMKQFMLKYAGDEELAFFMRLSEKDFSTIRKEDLPIELVVPAFMLSELKTGFKMGLMILLPFLIIDMVIASMLMSLGMFMLPPPIVALPIKLMIFVLVDGWTLLLRAIVSSFSL